MNIAERIYILSQEAQGKLDEIEAALVEVAELGLTGDATMTHDDLERARTALARTARRFKSRTIVHAERILAEWGRKP